MAFARARRSLPSLVNRSIVTVPDVLRIATSPNTGMAVLNACTKPVLNQLFPVGERPGAQAGVRARPVRLPSKTRSVLVVYASHVAGRSRHLL